MKGKGAGGWRKEAEEIRVAASRSGRKVKEVQRVRKLNKNMKQEDAGLGIAIGRSQKPGKHEAPRTQWR